MCFRFHRISLFLFRPSSSLKLETLAASTAWRKKPTFWKAYGVIRKRANAVSHSDLVSALLTFLSSPPPLCRLLELALTPRLATLHLSSYGRWTHGLTYPELGYTAVLGSSAFGVATLGSLGVSPSLLIVSSSYTSFFPSDYLRLLIYDHQRLNGIAQNYRSGSVCLFLFFRSYHCKLVSCY